MRSTPVFKFGPSNRGIEVLQSDDTPVFRPGVRSQSGHETRSTSLSELDIESVLRAGSNSRRQVSIAPLRYAGDLSPVKKTQDDTAGQFRIWPAVAPWWSLLRPVPIRRPSAGRPAPVLHAVNVVRPAVECDHLGLPPGRPDGLVARRVAQFESPTSTRLRIRTAPSRSGMTVKAAMAPPLLCAPTGDHQVGRRLRRVQAGVLIGFQHHPCPRRRNTRAGPVPPQPRRRSRGD
ncbi:hypothetical protein F4560_000830 [Saccharothrix ecbatanensis]|uniref:Uncharacterized protein n=1 Tax=Saccharothrix ecbatanensis TaxID=1105145 RepID=A0A7W9HEZ7_9PSEU|nr:hypothetical protein [Saccharothrix ecbatanensis]